VSGSCGHGYSQVVFTGIVQEIGRVSAVAGGAEGATVRIVAPGTAPTVAVGGSVAINGCCLTAEEIDGETIVFHAVPETLARTGIGALEPGFIVNVEAAVRAGEPLGGHYVQGHVDGIGHVASVVKEGEGLRVRVDTPPEILRYCVAKGSIVVDGVSLTVAQLDDTGFDVALIPHTLAQTTLGALVLGASVNLEVDVLAKYVERLLASRSAKA
jgi:riboflavin synthase